mmetsp:Transcript_24675/g.38382  ORF Transcript_24675/g.38382 Transcript_24675/m.38382 type:complete len:145 (+) Transcript_24675:951-1385(+)
MKVVARRGAHLFSPSVFDIADLGGDNSEGSVFLRTMYSINKYMGQSVMKFREVPKLLGQSSAFVVDSIRRNYSVPIQHLFQQHTDKRTFHDVVKAQGYDFENLEVETEDGYIIQMSRLPNKGKFDVVFLQHGIFDTCWTWLIHG